MNSNLAENNTSDQSLRSKNHNSGDRRDEQDGAPEVVLRSQATHHDVLCGRGNGFLYHPGNLFYLKVIKEYQLIYQVEKSSISLTNKAKRSIVHSVIKIIHNLDPPGRFLQFIKREKVNGKMEEIYHVVTDDFYKMKKVSQALREKEKPKKSRSKKKKKFEEHSRNAKTEKETTVGSAISDCKKHELVFVISIISSCKKFCEE